MFFSRRKESAIEQQRRAWWPVYRQAIESLENRTMLSGNPVGTIVTPIGATAANPLAAVMDDMVVGDFNHDGKLDTASIDIGVDVRLGKGNGTFGDAATNTQVALTNIIPGYLIEGDFNGDGNLDLGEVIGDFNSTTAPVLHILTGNGDGTFTAQPTTTTLSIGSLKPIVADVNNDGIPDLVVNNTNFTGFDVMLGNGDGSFQTAATNNVSNVASIAAADINGDGKTDLVVYNGSINAMFGNGDGTFAAPVKISSALSGDPVVVGDVNGDGIADIVQGANTLLANGDGTFTTVKSNLPDSTATTLVDVNGDGALDAISTELNGFDISLGDNDGTFAPAVAYADQSHQLLAVGDFTGDGNADVIGYSRTLGQVEVVPGNGDGTFKAATILPNDDVNNPFPAPPPAPVSPVPGGFLGDFNGDGIKDLAVVNTQTNTITIELGKADGTFGAPITFTPPANSATQPKPQIVSVGDINNDGKDDLIIYNPGLPEQVLPGGGEIHAAPRIIPATPATWTIFLSNGDGTFTPSTISSATSSPTAINNGTQPINMSADLDGDGNPDSITTTSQNVTQDLKNVPVGLLTITYALPQSKIGSQTFELGGDPNAVYVTDLNGDGLPDLVVTTSASNKIWTLMNTGAAILAPTDTNPAANPTPLTLRDGGIPAMMNAYTAFPFTSEFTFTPGIGTANLKFADFNQDGKTDIAVTNSLNEVSILLGNGDGSFQPGTNFDVAGGALGLGVADLNGDGFSDVAVPTNNGTSVGLMSGIGEQLGAAVGFRVSAPAKGIAGQSDAITVTAVDADGNPVSDFLGTVKISSNDPHMNTPLFYTFTAADAGTHTFQVKLDKSKADVVTASNPRLASGSATVNVTAGAAVGFTISLPKKTVAGVSFNAVVHAVDQFGNVAPSYTGTIDLSSNDPIAAMPASVTFSAADHGIETVPVRLFVAGNYVPAGFSPFSQAIGILEPADGPMITATDEASASITGTNGITVLAAPLSKIVVIAVPATTTGTALAGQAIDVTAIGQDAFGNPQSFPIGDVLHVTTTDPNGNAPANIVIRPPVNILDPLANVIVEWGNATNNQVIMTTAGAQTITVTDLSQPSIFSSTSITVFGSPAVKLAISVPANIQAGVPTPVTVSAVDQFGNVDPSFTGLAHFTSTDAGAVLPADSNFLPADAGSRTFNITFKTLGAQNISVHDLISFTLPIAQTSFTVIPGPLATLLVTSIASTTAGVAQNFTVTAMDAAGNVLNGFTGTVNFSSSDVQAGLPASYTFTAADAGTHSFAATLKSSGLQSVTVQSGTVSGSQSAMISAAAATHFALSASATATTGKSISVIATALDQFGNIATGYRGKVHFTDSVTSALPSDTAFSANDNGVHTFSITLSTAAKQTLTLSDTLNSLVNGSISIVASAPVSGGGGGATGGGGGATGGGGGGGGGGGKTA